MEILLAIWGFGTGLTFMALLVIGLACLADASSKQEFRHWGTFLMLAIPRALFWFIVGPIHITIHMYEWYSTLPEKGYRSYRD